MTYYTIYIFLILTFFSLSIYILCTLSKGGGRFSGILKREILVFTPYDCTQGPYSIRRDFLLAWYMSVDKYKKISKIIGRELNVMGRQSLLTISESK